MRGRFHQPIKSLGFAKQEDINRRVPDSASLHHHLCRDHFVCSRSEEYFTTLELTSRQIIMNTKGETRISLGEDMFLTCSEYRGVKKVHVRMFIPGNNSDTLFPTKYGVVMTQPQFKTLSEVLPSLMAELFKDEPTQGVTPINLGADLYLALTVGQHGTSHVHIRKFYHNKNNELCPSQYGITLSPDQTLRLLFSTNTILELFPADKESDNQLYLSQKHSDAVFTPDSKDIANIITGWTDEDLTSETAPVTEDIADTIAGWSDEDFTSETAPVTSSERREDLPPPAKKPKTRRGRKLSI